MTDNYLQRGNKAFEARLEERRASTSVTFIRHLRPGTRLLDVGCGPGTVTLDLARLVFPGEVVGIDIQTSAIDRARQLASDRKITNARFEVADAYQLPFADGSFDAAFAQTVLVHLRYPVSALAEIHRVLRPDGVVCVRDPDLGAAVHEPSTALYERHRDLRIRAHTHSGSDPFVARRHRSLLLEAGFGRTEGHAFADTAGTAEQCRRRADWLKAQLDGIARVGVARGWLDEATIDAIRRDIDTWAESPGSFAATLVCETLGWAKRACVL